MEIIVGGLATEMSSEIVWVARQDQKIIHITNAHNFVVIHYIQSAPCILRCFFRCNKHDILLF